MSRVNPKSNLLCAVWTYPQLQWLVTSDDRVYAPEPDKYFNLSNPRDLQSVTRKLESEHGWKIRKASGQWRAEKHGEWHERPILEDLVVLMVGRVKK
jgi:hypothetical protein